MILIAKKNLFLAYRVYNILMTSITLAGRLGDIVGHSFKFNTRTLKEVFAAIEANTGKLNNYFAKNKKRLFAIFVDGKEIDPHMQLNAIVKNKNILIIPVLFGGFVVTSTVIAAAILPATATAFAIKVTAFIIGTVLSAALSFGISLLISKLMKQDDPERVNTTSFIFGQAENTSRQGGIVPVGYGRMIIGSNTISVKSYSISREYFYSHFNSEWAISEKSVDQFADSGSFKI